MRAKGWDPVAGRTGDVPPASASPPPLCPLPTPRRLPERKVASCAFAYTCAPSHFLVPSWGKQSPKEKRFTCPASHCQVGGGVERSLK